MSKKMLIDATHAEETRVVVVDGNRVDDFDFESENKRQLAGNIYLAKVTRVEPSLQAAFVDYGGNRHGFLAFSEIHPDYYQIPVADREALLAEEMALDAAEAEEEEQEKPKRRGRRGRGRAKASETASKDAVVTEDASEVPAEAEDGTDEAAAAKEEAQEAEVGATEDAVAPEADGQNAADADEADPVAKDDGSSGDQAEELDEASEVQAEKRIPGMDVVDLDTDDEKDDDAPYNAAEHAAENDASIEAVLDHGSSAHGATRSRKLSRSGRYSLSRSSRKNVATRAPR